jgi:glycosyltransferase involved in cell wall biosynthesis
MKPKVVILSAFLTPFRSGAEACAEEVSQRLLTDYDITIVTARLRRDLPMHDVCHGVPVRRIGLGHAIDKWLYPLLAPCIARRYKPQLIHAILESYAGLALIGCRWLLPRTPRLLTCQSTNTSLFVSAMHRAATAVTVISRALRERAQGFGVTATLIPNGVRLRELRHAATTVERVPGRILFVGRLEPMKGVDTLLQAVALLPTTQAWTLHIVGAGSLRAKLEAQAQALTCASRIIFVGQKTPTEAAKEFAAAEIFVGLSRSEALGNVFIEAQAAGCAVLATRVGGIPDVVQDGHSGLLVPPNDPVAAAQDLSKLLIQADLRQQLSRQAIPQAGRYDWADIAEQYGEVYKKLTK